MTEREIRMIDLCNETVEITVGNDPNGLKRVWVNVDGVCRLRAYNSTVIIQDIDVMGLSDER